MVEEYEMNLPNTSSADMRVRIPAEMMPSEQQALQYFEYFFSNIHPYVPVLSQQAFYQQWNTNRESISPLLLDAIFACTSSMLESHPEGNKWLALAASEYQAPSVVQYSTHCSCRTRREFQRRSPLEHDPSFVHTDESKRIASEEGLFLSLLDDCSEHGGHVERSWHGPALRGSSGWTALRVFRERMRM